MENRKFCPTFLFYFFCSSELEMPFWRLGFVGSEASWHEKWSRGRESGGWCPLIRVRGGQTPARIVERFCPFESGTRGRDSFRFDLPGPVWFGLMSTRHAKSHRNFLIIHCMRNHLKEKTRGVGGREWLKELQIHMFDIIFETATRLSRYLNRKMQQHL